MWGKLNLPIFLFKVGLFTLINIDSLIFLAKPCLSLPSYYWEDLLGGGMTFVIAMMMYGRRILQVFFESFFKGPGDFPYVFIFTGEVTTLVPVYGPTFVDHGVLVLGGRPEGTCLL